MPNGAVTETTKTERTWAMACHLGALAVFLSLPLGNLIVPLVIWLVKKDEFPLVDDQGKESLNFQITVTIAAIPIVLLCFVLVGIPLLIALGIYTLVYVIIAAVKANEGARYRYPVTLRLIK